MGVHMTLLLQVFHQVGAVTIENSHNHYDLPVKSTPLAILHPLFYTPTADDDVDI